MLSFFPRGVLDEILNLIESVSEGFPSYSFEYLERFQRQCLRQIQGLPDNTPNGITLALLGILPLKTVIHKNALNLLDCLTLLSLKLPRDS